ncbi:hypothetical protein NEAUS04_0835 [Nematocida ausubeli]|nr:hypothetical protein NEAUS07_0530 [Nematocida ausubeli]KAI5162015.1 hypothetical protein NEAUS04_0835 [Nematocida ausubeli]
MKVPYLIIKSLGYALDRVLEVESNGLTGIQFSENVLPIGPTDSSLIVLDSPSAAKINYRIKIRNVHPLKIESGLHIADVVTVYADGSSKTTSVFNRPIIPDFTTPYLVFGVCGGIIVCLMSAYSKVLLSLI